MKPTKLKVGDKIETKMGYEGTFLGTTIDGKTARVQLFGCTYSDDEWYEELPIEDIKPVECLPEEKHPTGEPTNDWEEQAERIIYDDQSREWAAEQVVELSKTAYQQGKREAVEKIKSQPKHYSKVMCSEDNPAIMLNDLISNLEE